MIVIFNKVGLDRRILHRIRHHAIQWDTKKSGYMFAVSWSLTKRDWWKKKNEETAKFISWDWKYIDGEYVRTGVYIGRLAIVWQTRPKASVSTE